MEHMTVRTLQEDAFKDWVEARALWDRVVWSCPGAKAIYLLPARVRVVVKRADRHRFARGLYAYTRWRNHRRGESGAVWRMVAEPRAVPASLEAPAVRYVHREGCRAGLCSDPLSWPFSTHRDAVGMSLAPIRGRELEPHRFHRLTVGPHGTSELFRPVPRFLIQDSVDLPLRLRDLVSSLTRTPVVELRHRPRAQKLWIQALKHFTRLGAGQIGDRVGVVATEVRATPDLASGPAQILQRCLRDNRFRALSGPLPASYAGRVEVATVEPNRALPERTWWPSAQPRALEYGSQHRSV